MRLLPVLGIDLAAALLFAVIGRASHAHELSPAGIAQTAWPFLVAALIGSLIASWRGGSWWLQGLTVWAITVVGGLILRVVGGAGAAPGFVIVTSLVLALFLIGWRWLARNRLG